ncbi:MAG TPA: hypothetical protein PLI45_00560 [Candidatus Woesebacteria bacterium]|nr:hypothetical protein [Candidatus Woesebacteria bacterium]
MPVVIYIPSKSMSTDDIRKRMAQLAEKYEMTAICDTWNKRLKVKPQKKAVDLRSKPIKLPKYIGLHEEKLSNGQVDVTLSIQATLIERPHPLLGKTYIFGILVDESKPYKTQTPS